MLPFGNRTVIAHLTGAQLTEALKTASIRSATRDRHRAFPAGRRPETRLPLRRPRVRGRRNLEGTGRAAGPLTPVGPADTVRFVTNDFMFTGGDGYTAFANGTDVLQPGDGLLEISVDYITANTPFTPLTGATCSAPTVCRITNTAP